MSPTSPLPDDYWGRILGAEAVTAAARRELSADLRAKVKALPHADDCDFGRFTPDDPADCTCLRGKVLALFDGPGE